MLSYVFIRIIGLIPLLLGITLICFVVIHLSPGEPTDMLTALNPKASELAREKFKNVQFR